MNLLFDTNIILTIIRAKNYNGIIILLNPNNALIYVSVASEAEIKSIAILNNWGINRRNKLDDFLDRVTIIEINQLSINPYIEIDTFSQRRNVAFANYQFNSPRNMGKNDLWIAALAALLSLKLITTDADFDHLNEVYFEVRKIPIEDFTVFF